MSGCRVALESRGRVWDKLSHGLTCVKKKPSALLGGKGGVDLITMIDLPQSVCF